MNWKTISVSHFSNTVVPMATLDQTVCHAESDTRSSRTVLTRRPSVSIMAPAVEMARGPELVNVIYHLPGLKDTS